MKNKNYNYVVLQAPTYSDLMRTVNRLKSEGRLGDLVGGVCSVLGTQFYQAAWVLEAVKDPV